jgi:hypothetical protein
MTVDSTSILELILQFMTFLLSVIPLFFLGVQSTMTPPPMLPTEAPPAVTEEANMNRQPILIDGVELIVLESFPVQLTVDVRGSVQDGCQFPVMVEQSRDENTVTVEIFREMPPDVFCPMMIQDYNERIVLEGNFPLGEYVIRVNDFEITFDPSE